jgi:hypothetical protein
LSSAPAQRPREQLIARALLRRKLVGGRGVGGPISQVHLQLKTIYPSLDINMQLDGCQRTKGRHSLIVLGTRMVASECQIMACDASTAMIKIDSK